MRISILKNYKPTILFSLKLEILRSKILTLSTKTLLQYTVQMLFLQLALMQIQQCLFLLIYLYHLQSQQPFPLDRTGKKLPPATRWTHRVKDYALKEQQHVWQTEHEAVDPSWGYHPVLPSQFLQELWIPEESLRSSFRKQNCKLPFRKN